MATYMFGKDLTKAIKAFEKANVGGYPKKTSDMTGTEFNQLRFGDDIAKEAAKYYSRMEEHNMETEKLQFGGKKLKEELKRFEQKVKQNKYQFGDKLLKELKKYEKNMKETDVPKIMDARPERKLKSKKKKKTPTDMWNKITKRKR